MGYDLLSYLHKWNNKAKKGLYDVWRYNERKAGKGDIIFCKRLHF